MRGDTEITNREDVIDSRDIIDRIDYLEDERTAVSDKRDEAQEAYDGYDMSDKKKTAEEDLDALEELKAALEDAQNALKEWDESNEQELKALLNLADQAEGYSDDWKHGSTLIRDSYFKEYAQEFAEDIGAINNECSWPNNCIDWEKAADELKQDYTSVDFDGVDYWIR